MARMGIRTGRTTALTRRVCATDSETDMPIAPSSTGDDTAVTPPIRPDTTGDTVRSAVTGDGVAIGRGMDATGLGMDMAMADMAATEMVPMVTTLLSRWAIRMVLTTADKTAKPDIASDRRSSRPTRTPTIITALLMATASSTRMRTGW